MCDNAGIHPGSHPSLFCDWDVNRGRHGIQRLLVLFRLTQRLRERPVPVRWLGVALGRLYVACGHAFCGVDLPVQTSVGPRLAIHHGQGLVVNGATRIGADVVLRQNTTLGGRYGNDDCPVVGDGVELGPHVVVLGSVRLGKGCRVGAGAVVLADVPPGSTAVGNPARVISDGQGLASSL